jgi:class 3 adenylate cyclase/tetratricopeptide (TPR) repeat protein
MEQKHAAILFADVAGYTRLMEAFESDVHPRLMGIRDDVLNVSLSTHEGRVVKRTGDGFLALFEEPRQAVGCALAIQTGTRLREANQPPERRISFRIGVNLGKVWVETEDVYGNDVNVAARLQDLAEPGDVLISARIRDALGADLENQAIDLGFLRLKNMTQPVRAFRMPTGIEEARPRLRPIPSPDHPSIAVLPFRTLDADTPRFLGDGLVEDIVGALATFRELLVISARSTKSYRDETFDARTLGQQLGVKYLLAGSLRTRPHRLQIMTQLLQTENASVLWARRYDQSDEELFQIQDEITASIVNTIVPHVRQAEIKQSYRKRSESKTAYDYFLQAIDLMYTFEPDDFAQAGALIRRAIALDDSYAEAYAFAAEWHSLKVGQGWSSNPEVDSTEAIRLAQVSVNRDPANALALALLGHHRAYLFRDYEAAISLFDRALDASPSNARAWGLSAPTYTYIGDPPTAITRAQRALRLSPHDPVAFWYQTTICIAYYAMGEYEKAIEAGYLALASNSRYTTVYRTMAAALAASDRFEEAHVAGQRVLELEPEFQARAYADRYPYRDLSRREQFYHHLIAAGLPE